MPWIRQVLLRRVGTYPGPPERLLGWVLSLARAAQGSSSRVPSTRVCTLDPAMVCTCSVLCLLVLCLCEWPVCVHGLSMWLGVLRGLCNSQASGACVCACCNMHAWPLTPRAAGRGFCQTVQLIHVCLLEHRLEACITHLLFSGVYVEGINSGPSCTAGTPQERMCSAGHASS